MSLTIGLNEVPPRGDNIFTLRHFYVLNARQTSCQETLSEASPSKLREVRLIATTMPLSLQTKMFNREALEEIVRRHPDSFPAQALLNGFHHFEGLHDVLHGRWVPGWGSYLFNGETYAYEPRCLKKQEELYTYSMTAKNAIELGVYLGHSLLLMLMANPALKITAIDCDETYAGPAVRYLNEHFGNRITFLKGDAVEVMKTLQSGAYDLLHIDADHNDAAVKAQFNESLRLATAGATYVFDDFDAIARTVGDLVQGGILEIKALPSCLWRNCVAMLTNRFETDAIVALARPMSCCSAERLHFNIEAVRKVNARKVEGAIVEIGVYKGGSMVAMMRADQQDREFFLYDTFQGMTPPSDFDVDYNGFSAEVLMNSDARVKCASPLKEVQENIFHSTHVPSSRIHYIVGDIMKATTFPEKIAVLRLDTDFYDSTKFELEHFYDRVSPGGIVIVDDFGHWKGCRRAVEEFLDVHPTLKPIPIDYTGVYFEKPGMDVFYVTAFFGRQDGFMSRSLDEYLTNFEELARCRISIGVYLDPQLRALGENLAARFRNVTILDHVAVESDFLPPECILPANRCPKKDTEEYMCIQLMKLRLMALAAQDERISHPAIAWIDFGIFHMFQDKAACGIRLESLRVLDASAIHCPGAWKEAKYDLFEKVLWRYCGSFCVGEKSLFLKAAVEQDEIVRRHLPRLTWEVNYWTLMSSFRWYKADHNDTILEVSP